MQKRHRENLGRASATVGNQEKCTEEGAVIQKAAEVEVGECVVCKGCLPNDQQLENGLAPRRE